MWNLKYGTNELIYKSETLIDIENRLVVGQGGREVEEGWIESLRLADAKYHCRMDKVQLYSTENYIQYPIENQGLPWWLSDKESVCKAGDTGSIPGLGRSPGKENGNPLQYSCLGNPWTEEPGDL